MKLEQLITVCHRCPKRGAPVNGVALCLVDGRDIVAHATAGECPVGRYPKLKVKVNRPAESRASSSGGCGCGKGRK